MSITLTKSSEISKSRSKNIPVPTPRPKVEQAQTQSQGQNQTDRSSFSREAKAGELGASSNSPVNFAAWDSPAPVGDGKVAESSSVGDLGSKTLRQGMRSDEVKALQEKLKANGAEIDVDGIFGKQTSKAVKEFQKSQGIDVDGLVGKDTRKAFDGLAGAPGETPGEGGAQAGSKDETKGEAPVEAAQASQIAEQAAAQAKSDGAGAAEAGASEKTSGVPGTDDTSWTEKLPKGLQPHAQAFIDAGKKHGVDPRFLAAISSQETGGGTSKAFKNKNNAMGIMKGKKLRTFDSVADSINSQARSLTREGGYYSGKDTISKIGGTYAPIGAANDPGGLNRHWVPNITKFYESLGGDASAPVKGF